MISLRSVKGGGEGRGLNYLWDFLHDDHEEVVSAVKEERGVEKWSSSSSSVVVLLLLPSKDLFTRFNIVLYRVPDVVVVVVVLVAEGAENSIDKANLSLLSSSIEQG